MHYTVNRPSLTGRIYNPKYQINKALVKKNVDYRKKFRRYKLEKSANAGNYKKQRNVTELQNMHRNLKMQSGREEKVVEIITNDP